MDHVTTRAVPRPGSVAVPLRRSALRRTALVLTLAGAVGAVAACGSSSSPSSSSPASPSASAGTVSAAPGATGGGSSPAAAVAAAKQIPTTIPVTDPLKSAPPTGKTVVYLQCAESQCAFEGKGIQAAAAALGWKFKLLNFNETNPSTLVAGLKQALQYKPVAVMFPGVPEQLWQSVLPAYRAAKVKIVPAAPGQATVDDVVAGVTQGNDWQEKIATYAANFVAADSGGSANILTLSVPSYPVFVPNVTKFESTLKTACPNCKNTEVDATIPQLLAGQIPGLIVSSLKRNPGVKYVYAVDGAFITGLDQALKAAGLAGKYKIVSTNGSATNMKNIQDGVEEATTGSGFVSYGWYAVDIALRAIQGLPIPQGDLAGLPAPFLTKDNVGTPADSYDVPTDYANQFKKLWGLS